MPINGSLSENNKGMHGRSIMVDELEDRLLRPAKLLTVADYLNEAIAELAAWGVRIPTDSRLHRMSALLTATAAAGSYPVTESELSLLSDAIRHAQEFIEIANVLPKGPIESLRHDLGIAVRGELGPVGAGTGQHFQFQTQLWVGAMLAQSAARTAVLMRPGQAANPDYVLEEGTLRYAVEVKRPNGVLDAHNIVRKAARQIRNPRFHGGMIVVDLTDCIDRSLRHRFGHGPPDFGDVRAEVDRLLYALHSEVFEDGPERLRGRREHVFGLYAFCRVAYWNRDELAYPFLIRMVGVVCYWRRDQRTLRAIRARWLTDLVGRGIEAAGHQPLGVTSVGWAPPRSA